MPAGFHGGLCVQTSGASIMSQFQREFRFCQMLVHEIAIEKGFWEGRRNDAEMIALMHSELSEALEVLRKTGGPIESDAIPGFSELEEELADVIIRIMDFAQGRGLNVAGAIVAKSRYNARREFRHGKEF